nr:MAG TPA: hypothetical protein [Caudoviricetes sp.]
MLNARRIYINNQQIKAKLQRYGSMGNGCTKSNGVAIWLDFVDSSTA